MCRLMECGGLGLRSLKGTNRALLNKWLWKFGSSKDATWRGVVAAKYREEQYGWFTGRPSGPVFGRISIKGWGHLLASFLSEYTMGKG